MKVCSFSQTVADEDVDTPMMNAADLVTCPMCLNIFDNSRSLPCAHSFCLACLNSHCKDKAPASKPCCPLCKQNFQIPADGVEELPCNQHIQRLVDCRRSSSCQLFGGEKANLDSDEANARTRRLRGVQCEKHDGHLTNSHCLDCRQNVCSSCSETHHKQHKLKTIDTFAAELKQQIEADVKKVSSRVADIRNDAVRLETKRDEFVEDVGRQATAIRQKGEEMKTLIDRKVAELLQELESIKADSLSPAQAAEARLQQAGDAVQSYCDYSHDIRTTGSAHDVVRYASAIHAQATHLLENRITYADLYTLPCVMFMPSDAGLLSTRQLLGHISTPLSSSGAATCCSEPKYYRTVDDLRLGRRVRLFTFLTSFPEINLQEAISLVDKMFSHLIICIPDHLFHSTGTLVNVDLTVISMNYQKLK